tara:strand:- start:45 stop:164 length:120 start_codon:yes stop_codon:yes gene_type:complete
MLMFFVTFFTLVLVGRNPFVALLFAIFFTTFFAIYNFFT